MKNTDTGVTIDSLTRDMKAWITLNIFGMVCISNVGTSGWFDNVMEGKHSRQILIKEDGDYQVFADFANSGPVTITHNDSVVLSRDLIHGQAVSVKVRGCKEDDVILLSRVALHKTRKRLASVAQLD